MKNNTYIEKGIVILVGLVIVVGLVQVGSPQSARDIRFDRQRSDRIDMLANDVSYHYQREGKLIGALDELSDDPYIPKVDPETGDPIGFERVSPTKFFLCATFASEAEEEGYQLHPYRDAKADDHDDPLAERANPHTHGEGYECFTFVVREQATSTQK